MKKSFKKHTISTFLGIILLGLFPGITQAQWASANMTTYPKRENNIKSIDLLKKGVLVIRLESKRNNIKKLTESIELKSIDEKLRRQLKVQRAQVIEERDNFNNDLIAAFADHYEFSDYVFMMDTSAVHLMDGVREGIFLSKSLEIDPAISIEGQEFLIMRIGSLSAENTTGIEALIFSDHKLQDMQRPFPYHISLNHRLRLKSLFSKKGSLRRDPVDLVEEIERKFNSFYGYFLKRSYKQRE